MTDRDLPMLALDRQLDLLRFTKSAYGLKLLGGLGASMGIAAEARFDRMWSGPLSVAETFAVTGEITEVIQAAAESIPPYELHAEDLPAAIGFVHFAETIILPDSRGKPLAVTDILWARVSRIDDSEGDYQISLSDGPASDENQRGILFLLFTDADDPRDHMHSVWSQDLRQETLNTFGSLPPGQPMLGGLWNYGELPTNPLSGDKSELHQLMMTFFRFVQEPWVEHRAIVPNRQARKRAARQQLEPQVRIVQLRKANHESKRGEGDGEPVEWNHRWLVKGHWRNQWYPSQRRNAPKWIMGYIKGPDDKPLIVKERIFSVDR